MNAINNGGPHCQSQLQVKFVTKQEQYAVSDTPYSIAGNTTPTGLNELLNNLIYEGISDAAEKKRIRFTFIIGGEILHCKISEHLQSLNISAEHDICVEYVEAVRSPQPSDCLEHDDWVSSVHTCSQWILSGCYDNTVHIWSCEKQHKHLLTINGHSGPVKGVTWIRSSTDDGGNRIASFISSSHDQTSLLWEWNIGENNAKPMYVYRGHERSVNCVSAKPSESLFVTGGWDCTLKIWSTDSNASNHEEKTSSKKHKSDKIDAPLTRIPTTTLKGHKESISTVQWLDNNEIMSASWDHTLKLWDPEYGGIKSEVVSHKTIFNAHYSRLNNLIITCGADRHVRLFDPRSNDGSIVKRTFTSHKEWVQCVKWSTTNEFLFVSGSYDNDLKLWDTRSSNTPLYDMLGHRDKVLCCDWSKSDVIVSGSSDATLRLFSTE